MDARRQGVSCAAFIRPPPPPPPLPALPSCEQKMEPIIIFVIRFSSPRFLPLRALTSGLFISVWTWIATRNRGGPSTSPSNRSGDAQRATTTTNRQCPGRNRGKTNRGTDPPRPKHLPPLALSRAARRQPPPPPRQMHLRRARVQGRLPHAIFLHIPLQLHRAGILRARRHTGAAELRLRHAVAASEDRAPGSGLRLSHLRQPHDRTGRSGRGEERIGGGAQVPRRSHPPRVGGEAAQRQVVPEVAGP